MHYSVQHFVHRSQRWEPVQDGLYKTAEEAVTRMRELELKNGWRDLKVLDPIDRMVCQGLSWSEIPPVSNLQELHQALCAVELHGKEMATVYGHDPFERNFNYLTRFPKFGGNDPAEVFPIHAWSWDAENALVGSGTPSEWEIVPRVQLEAWKGNYANVPLTLDDVKNPDYTDAQKRMVQQRLNDQLTNQHATYRRSDAIFQTNDGEIYAAFGDTAYHLSGVNVTGDIHTRRTVIKPIIVDGQAFMEDSRRFKGIATMFWDTHQKGVKLSAGQSAESLWSTYLDCNMLSRLQKTPNGDWIDIGREVDKPTAAHDDAFIDDDSPSP